MVNEKQLSGDKPMRTALIELYDEYRDLTDYYFFFCEALEGMLSPDLALEPETVSGIRISAGWMKSKSRELTKQFRHLCEQLRQEI